MNTLSNKLFKRICLSFFLATILIVIILIITDKYRISVLNKENSHPNRIYYYHDLDKDGNSEKLNFQKNNVGRIGLLVYENNKIINHWNFEGEWGQIDHPFIADLNIDGKDEIFIFSQINDSLYLHCVDPINNRVVFRNKAITKVYKAHGIYDYGIYKGVLYDMDSDGIKEIYFSISTGYSTKPRNLFVYNYKKDTVIVSPESCAPLFSPIAYDFDYDDIPEFLCSTHAVANCSLNIEYSDHYSWLMVFRPDLNFKFEPIPFNAYPSLTKFGTLKLNKDLIFVFHLYRGTEDYSSFMALFNCDGFMLKSKDININPEIQQFELINETDDKSYIYLIADIGKVFKIDTMLNFKKYINVPKLTGLDVYYKLDIDNDASNEYIFRGQYKNQFVITRHNFKHAITVSLDRNFNAPYFSLKEATDFQTQLVVDTEEYTYYFNYGKSIVYKYWHLMIALNTVIIYLVFYVAAKIGDYRKLKLKETQKKISELQLKSFQNHIDPHFTFNIIESFGNLINEKNPEKASFLFNNYTRMLKSALINSDNAFISLEDELDFVRNYLNLEVYRNNYKFDYKINIQKGLDESIIIPKMLIHIFVENAVKHGVRHLTEGGLVKIKIYEEGSDYRIFIKDNGIGREKAKELAWFSTGRGLKIIDEILGLYNRLYRVNIGYETIDLESKEKASGTLVKIKIPTKQLYHAK